MEEAFSTTSMYTSSKFELSEIFRDDKIHHDDFFIAGQHWLRPRTFQNKELVYLQVYLSFETFLIFSGGTGVTQVDLYNTS